MALAIAVLIWMLLVVAFLWLWSSHWRRARWQDGIDEATYINGEDSENHCDPPSAFAHLVLLRYPGAASDVATVSVAIRRTSA